MQDRKLSRREFAAKAAAAMAAIALVPDAPAQTTSDGPGEVELKALESKLEKPLPEKLKNPAKAALRNIQTAAKERQKYKLPEGSEPCTTYIPLPPRSRER